MSAFLFLLVKLNLAMGMAVILVALLRRPLRELFGAPIAYAIWFLVPAAGLAVLLPPRVAAPVTAVHVPAMPSLFDPQSVISHAAPLRATEELAGQGMATAIAALPPAPVYQWPDIALLLFAAWTLGVLVMVLYLTRSQLRFSAAVRLGKAGPAVLGFFRPRIVTPDGFQDHFTPQEQAAILAHERVHLGRQDARINALAALLRCLCWFNPLIHLGARWLRIDQELACDASVVATSVSRRDYAEALLKSQIAVTALPLGCYWPGAQHPLVERIALLKRKRPGVVRRALGMSSCFAGGGLRGPGRLGRAASRRGNACCHSAAANGCPPGARRGAGRGARSNRPGASGPCKAREWRPCDGHVKHRPRRKSDFTGAGARANAKHRRHRGTIAHRCGAAAHLRSGERHRQNIADRLDTGTHDAAGRGEITALRIEDHLAEQATGQSRGPDDVQDAMRRSLDRRLLAGTQDVVMAANTPSGVGDPDVMVCRVPQRYAGSDRLGPAACGHNWEWLTMALNAKDLAADGKTLIDKPTVANPTGEGDPDGVTCRAPKSAMRAPVCETNRFWANLIRNHQTIDKPTVDNPTGEGDPDGVTCRTPKFVWRGPLVEVCRTNRFWADVVKNRQWVDAYGVVSGRPPMPRYTGFGGIPDATGDIYSYNGYASFPGQYNSGRAWQSSEPNPGGTLPGNTAASTPTFHGYSPPGTGGGGGWGGGGGGGGGGGIPTMGGYHP